MKLNQVHAMTKQHGLAPRFGMMEALLLLVAIIWGGSYSAAKLATQYWPVLPFLTLRFGLTFVLLLPALRGVSRLPSWQAAVLSAAGLGINLLLIFVAETYGVSLTSASNAAFLISLCVAFTPLCEWLLLHKVPSKPVVAAVAVSLVGAGLLAFRHGAGWSGVSWGDGLMVVAAALRGVMVTLTRRHGGRHTIPALTLTAVQMGVMTVGCGVLSIATLHAQDQVWPDWPVSGEFWWAVCFLVVLCTLLAFFVQNYAATRSSPTKVAVLMGSEPIWGALIAVIWMNESLGLQGWVGGALIVLSAWWVTRMPS